MPAQDSKKPVRRTTPRALAAKPVAAIAAKPIAAKPVATKPEAQPAAPKPAAPTPAAAKAASLKPAAPKAVAPAKAVATPAAKPAPAKAAPAAVMATTAAPAKSAPAKAVAPVTAPPAPASAMPAAAPTPVVAAPVAAAVAAVLPPPEVLPKAVRGVADTGLAQARDAYATFRQSAEQLSTGLNSSGEAVARGLQTLSSTMLEQIHANADATLGFVRAMAGVRTLSEAIELQARHARQQFETVTAQAKTLAGIVNRTANETTEPVKKAIDVALRRSA